MASFCHIKEKISSKNSAKTWKLVPSPFVFAMNLNAQLVLENEIFEETTYNRYLLAKLSKFVHISMLTSSDSFSQRIFWKLKRGSGTSFKTTFFIEFVVTWPNVITRLCLLPKLFSKMCLMFHTWAIDDVILFEYLKS